MKLHLVVVCFYVQRVFVSIQSSSQTGCYLFLHHSSNGLPRWNKSLSTRKCSNSHDRWLKCACWCLYCCQQFGKTRLFLFLTTLRVRHKESECWHEPQEKGPILRPPLWHQHDTTLLKSIWTSPFQKVLCMYAQVTIINANNMINIQNKVMIIIKYPNQNVHKW